MKRLALIASLLVSPLITNAQFVVFTDSFNSGSTVNHASVPGGTPFASFTSYDIAASKAALTNNVITSGDFRSALDAPTSSGLIEIQALFTKAPITLVNIGDYINLTYTFRMTNALETGSAYLAQGLYYSGGQPPVAGTLNNNGLGGTGVPTGNCQLWQGIFSRIFSNANSVCISRPMQNGANLTARDQSLVSPDAVTGGFNNPAGPTLVGGTNAGPLTLANGAYYTISYTITLADTNTPTLAITNILYSGAGTGGTVLLVMTNAATDTNFQTSFDGLAFGRREVATVPITMDITNITISENIFGLPGQPFNVTGGGQGCPGNTFPVGLNGSVTTNDYYLYTNGVWSGVVQTGTGSALSFPAETVITVPLTNTVVASNTMSGFTGPMLGSVVVAPNAAPSITGQPVPVLVVSGSIGVFNVVASGGGLTYQWYRNGGALANTGHISGSTSPTLVISPATAADAATVAQGYYCIVTSGCGISSTTTTNSLTLDTAANLVWQGGNPNTNWDLSTTANFKSGASSVVFHNGDNVTFDDSSTVPALSISGNFIAPTLITESANQSYTFNGPGVIQGPGALLKSGAGNLTINNSNAYTGGTIISSGTLVLNSLFAVGGGTIGLAGGTFDIPITPSSAVGLSNNINITADSTLQFDQKGTFGCILNGAITGNSSATLTINSTTNSSSTARVRMYGAFTNNANVVLISSSGTSEIELAPYLPSGNQVFNGIISGTSGRLVPRGAGNVILNNTNTFSDQTGISSLTVYSLFMSSGNAGFGADSVSSTPPTIDASPAGTGIVGINVGAEGGNCSFFASGGAHTIANQFQYTSTSNTVTVIFSGANDLTMSGEFDIALTGDPTGTNRTIQVTNTAATTLAGTITDNSANNAGASTSGITKTGSGSLFLNGANIYAGPTTNNAGLLAGSGSIAGPVFVNTNSSIGGGSAASIGTLTINNNLTVNGDVFIRVNKSLSPAQSNDVISVSGALNNTGTGTLTVSNLGPALVVGDKFVLFNKPVVNGGALIVTGGGMNWTNRLATDGSIQALSAASGVATNPTNITFSVGGGNLSLSWPGDHLGWFLQMQTNSLQSNTWTDVAGSSTVTNVMIPINQSLRAVFFRMSLQP